MAFVVVTTWLLIQSARGSPRVWSTPITQLRTKDISTPAYQRKSFYITTSARLAPYLGQPQLPDRRGSSAELIYPTGPSQAEEFTRAKYVSIGTGYVRANDPSTALRQMGQPVYAAVPTADPNFPEEDPSGVYGGVVVRSSPTQSMPGPGVSRQIAPTLSAFFDPNALSSQSSITSARSYPYPFPAIPPSQSESRPTSHGPSLMDQLPLHTQPPDRGYTTSPLRHNQTSNGPVPARVESFRARGVTSHQTAATGFSLYPYYTGQEYDDDASSIASQYSTATTVTKVNPKYPGTALPPISVQPSPPKLPPAGPPPPIPMRSPMRQSFARSDPRVHGQQGSIHSSMLRKV